MKQLFVFTFTLIILLNKVSGNEPLTFRQKMALDRDVVLEAMYKAKTWQEAQHKGPVPTNWLTGTLYTGVYACYEATGKQDFLKASRDWCIAAEWKCGEKSPLHADDICSAQTFLDVYAHDKKPYQIEHIKNLIDTYYINAKEITEKLARHTIWPEESRPFTGRNLWWWCDALYMAPPVLARLGTHTGEQKYFDLLHKLYWDSKEFLYDTEEKLFYRDTLEFAKRTPNGKKVFWSRGNGWVVGGLVRTIDYLPDSDPMKVKYIELFKEMMLRLATLQKPDGTWSSAVNDPEWLPEPESSASAFYTFALAAGINRGWLKEEVFLPVLIKAWEGLLFCLREDGKLEWAQIVDRTARKVRHEDHKNYAQGAFLLAAAEIYKLNMTPEKYKKVYDNRRIVTVAEEGAWTWYNDERAVFWNKHLVLGNMNNEGKSTASFYLLPGLGHSFRIESLPLSSWTEKDDHNNPAILPINNDSLLLVYSKHHTAKSFNTRIITSNIFYAYDLKPEKTVSFDSKITYSNLMKLNNEGNRIYNFFRGKGWNPNMVTSDDDGETWSKPVMIFQSGDDKTRPYVKYATDTLQRIELFYTDGHPRKEKQNNIYHAYYQKGYFYKSNGKRISSVKKIQSKPLSPGKGTLIYDGSGPEGRGWVHDIERGENNQLAGVFISSADGDKGNDLRYHYSYYNPKTRKWNVNKIGFAGTHLYEPENHYAGGICIDPANINVVYLSSDVHPGTGKPNVTGKYQIFKAETSDNGKSWTYKQLTFDVVNDNLRPVVPRNKPEFIEDCIIWFRGEYKTFTDYNCEIVGYVTRNDN